MPDYAGPLQRLVLTRTLWLVVAWPIVGFVWQVVVARRRVLRARGPNATRHALASARNAGVAGVALATASTLAHVVVLARAPGGGRVLYEHFARGVRLGQFDGEVDLSFDQLSATFCVLACLVALGASVFVAMGPPAERGWRTWALLQLSLAGALVAFASDGFVGTAIGWTIAAAASGWLAGWADARMGILAAMRTAVAIAAMLLGAVLLFWGLGGSWEGDEYAPDPQPRLAAVRVGGWPDGNRQGREAEEPSVGTAVDVSSISPQHGQHGDERAGAASGGSLTLTSMPGAYVFLDDTRVPSMRSPFVGVPVRRGTHTLRVRSGDGSNDDMLGTVTFDDADEEVALVPYGPTLAFRAISDQLVLHDRQGDAAVRSALELRSGPGGATVVASSLVLLLIAAGFMSGAPPPRGAPPALCALTQGATTAALGPYLLTRMAFLFPLAPNTWMAVESVGAAILLAGGWRAPASSGIRRWLAFVGVAPAALACLALGAAGVAGATYVMVLSGTAAAALYLVTARAGQTSEHDPAAAQEDMDRNGPGQGSLEDLFLVRAPTSLGALLVSMDRWVVSPIVEAIGTLARAGAWVIATVDHHVVAAPADIVSGKLVRAERRVEAMIGVTLGRVAWGLLAALGLVAVAQALRSGR